MHHDVIVIGGSYAGMAAALQLVRARRSVLVIDAGERRNRFASHSHGFLGQDGVPPGEIAANARRQLDAYPTLSWIKGRVEAITGQVDEFTVTMSDHGSYRGRRILLATGVADQLPAVEGLAERWGTAIFHCPYCHGYELGQGRIGIVGVGPMSIHQAELLTDWGDVTLLVNGAVELSLEARSTLERRGVAIEEAPIDRIEGNRGQTPAKEIGVKPQYHATPTCAPSPTNPPPTWPSTATATTCTSPPTGSTCKWPRNGFRTSSFWRRGRFTDTIALARGFPEDQPRTAGQTICTVGRSNGGALG